MNKRTLSLVAVIVLCGYSGLFAVTGKILSELSLQRGVIHYPLEVCEPERSWQIDVWGAGYWRKACSAFACDDCNAHGATTKTTDLSKLFFGKSSFKAQEAFAGGSLTVASGYPGLVFATISPRFSYNESGVFLGFHAQKDLCDSCWSLGWRASLPVSRVKVQQGSSCGCEEWDADVNNVAVCRQEFTNGESRSDNNTPNGYGPNMNDACAYRLDFLGSLLMPDGTPMITYGDGTSNTTVAEIPITLYSQSGIPEGSPVGDVIAPMYVLYAQNGNLANAITIGTTNAAAETNNLARNVGPTTPTDATEVAQWILNADGTNHNPDTSTNGDRLAFSKTVNYAGGLGADQAQQKQWFLVPNAAATGNYNLITNANAVQNAIHYVLSGMEQGKGSASDFFKKHGINLFQSDCAVGAGDLYTEWYAGYHPECWYADMLLGMKFPTGKRLCDARRIYWQPTGNNGHVELRTGVEGGWEYSWFALRGMATYTYVFKRTEMRAPAFEGATIKNIPVGDPTPTKVHWGYLWGNIDCTLFHPKCPDCGLVLGYELYVKQHDKVCFCRSTATDFLGYTHKLDNKILERGTDTRLHKLRGEFFHRIGCCEYFGGAYYSLAGRFALKETEFHVGAAIYF
jgi:hypothetical protein